MTTPAHWIIRYLLQAAQYGFVPILPEILIRLFVMLSEPVFMTAVSALDCILRSGLLQVCDWCVVIVSALEGTQSPCFLHTYSGCVVQNRLVACIRGQSSPLGPQASTLIHNQGPVVRNHRILPALGFTTEDLALGSRATFYTQLSVLPPSGQWLCSCWTSLGWWRDRIGSLVATVAINNELGHSRILQPA